MLFLTNTNLEFNDKTVDSILKISMKFFEHFIFSLWQIHKQGPANQHSASEEATSIFKKNPHASYNKSQFNICHMKMRLLTYPHELLTNPLKIL